MADGGIVTSAFAGTLFPLLQLESSREQKEKDQPFGWSFLFGARGGT